MTRPGINVDPSEISKFAAMAAYWWDPEGKLKSLHAINPLRLGYIDSRASLKGKRVLDVGCGGGILSEAMARFGAHVTGIDMSEASLSAAISHMQVSGLSIDYRSGTAETFADHQSGAFDMVTCMELLEHVPNPENVVRACGHLVKPGGDVFFATLNRNLKSLILAIICAEYLLGMVERGTHRYKRFIKPGELTSWAAKSGLSVRDITGLHYNPITRRFFLGGNTHVNYMIHFQR